MGRDLLSEGAAAVSIFKFSQWNIRTVIFEEDFKVEKSLLPYLPPECLNQSPTILSSLLGQSLI
jgi:hypothetical protein